MNSPCYLSSIVKSCSNPFLEPVLSNKGDVSSKKQWVQLRLDEMEYYIIPNIWHKIAERIANLRISVKSGSSVEIMLPAVFCQIVIINNISWACDRDYLSKWVTKIYCDVLSWRPCMVLLFSVLVAKSSRLNVNITRQING